MQVIIGHNGRDISTKWHLDQVTVTSSGFPGREFVFVCQKWVLRNTSRVRVSRTG